MEEKKTGSGCRAKLPSLSVNNELSVLSDLLKAQTLIASDGSVVIGFDVEADVVNRLG